MWLLDTASLKLCEFLPQRAPPYAILSHTWGDEEVSFQDMQKPGSKHLKGYKKIKQCCAVARSQQFQYAWIDTCCIDKKSSAELSEAINSMFAWYKSSAACYVYMNDVSLNASACAHQHRGFAESRWFRRGWTLQELLAPKSVEFFDHRWRHIGRKSYLCSQLSKITGIEIEYLRDGSLIPRASIAARMSWASRRSTTRPEDEAYCLLGLFNVNMPLLYGEGTKAFLRLQQEISKNSNDESLFAWHAPGSASGIFAPSSSAFENSGHIYPYSNTLIERPPYFITNRGLSIEIYCRDVPWETLNVYTPMDEGERSYQYLIFSLNCHRKGTQGRPFVIILRSLTPTRPGTSPHTFIRFLPGDDLVQKEFSVKGEGLHVRKIYIQDPTSCPVV